MSFSAFNERSFLPPEHKEGDHPYQFVVMRTAVEIEGLENDKCEKCDHASDQDFQVDRPRSDDSPSIKRQDGRIYDPLDVQS